MDKTRVAIFGAGQIGQAVYKILMDLKNDIAPGSSLSMFIIDNNREELKNISGDNNLIIDLSFCTLEDIVTLLKEEKTTHVINALPFLFNEKIALASKIADCGYIDFTEDDVMADKVQAIYKVSNLTCAVKCGLAPGFINYIGYDLVNKVKIPKELIISVGALPRTAMYSEHAPAASYNLSWSVDGLVNEYIRPCRIRSNGEEIEVPALTLISKVMIDGTEYEAAHTSGGIGSLVRDLTDVSYVAYMTLRYPGHYQYVKEVVSRHDGDFNAIKKEFLETFRFTDDDVIVVYATSTGSDGKNHIQRSYSNKFYGVNGLTAIQSTTAGSGVAMLELILAGKVKGNVNHTDIKLSDFTDTHAFKKYYKTAK